MSDTGAVQLRTGIEVHRALVTVLTVALRHALRNEPLTLLDAVEMAHTERLQPFSAARLEALGFTQSGQMRAATRDVVLAATEGRGMDIRLVDPVVEPLGGEAS